MSKYEPTEAELLAVRMAVAARESSREVLPYAEAMVMARDALLGVFGSLDTRGVDALAAIEELMQ